MQRACLQSHFPKYILFSTVPQILYASASLNYQLSATPAEESPEDLLRVFRTSSGEVKEDKLGYQAGGGEGVPGELATKGQTPT